MTPKPLGPDPGRLRWRVALEAPPIDAAPNALGEEPDAWSVEWEGRAEVVTLSGGEQYREQQVQPDATHKVTIRWRPGVDESMRFDFRGRKLNIYRTDDPDQLSQWLICYCREAK